MRPYLSLDLFPDSQMKNSIDVFKLPGKIRKRKSHDSGAAVISNCNENNSSSTDVYKYLNNNCKYNGSNDDEQVRQASVLHDQLPLLHNKNKRWHSLETIGAGNFRGCEVSYNEETQKKSLGRSSIKSWLFGIFQSNGNTRNSSASLKKVGMLATGSDVVNQTKKSESIV